MMSAVGSEQLVVRQHTSKNNTKCLYKQMSIITKQVI